MTDIPTIDAGDAPPLAPTASEDKVLPAVVYGLYLLGLSNGLTIVVGLLVAYFNRHTAGPINESHYTFQIRTFWLAIWWFLVGLALVLFGIPLLIVGIGVLAIAAGVFIMTVISVWFLVRCAMGIVYLAKGEAYPRPRAWLI